MIGHRFTHKYNCNRYYKLYYRYRLSVNPDSMFNILSIYENQELLNINREANNLKYSKKKKNDLALNL